MNFALKSTDIFESSHRPGKFAIKIVDAKFALPKSLDDETADFVCLDMPDYPAEHDDIMITFDAEKGQTVCVSSLIQPSINSLAYIECTMILIWVLARIRSAKLRVETAWNSQRGLPHGVSSEITSFYKSRIARGEVILVRYQNGVPFQAQWNGISLF